MPHTMPKAPNPTTPRRARNAFDPAAFMPTGRYTPHRPGETGRQLAERLRREEAASAAPAAPAKAPRKRKATTDAQA